MTGNLLIDSLISLGAIAVMVLVAYLMFRSPAAPVDEKAAAARLAFDEPDFSASAWLIDHQGKAALAEGAAGEFALVARHGADLVTRRFGPDGAKARLEEGALILHPRDPAAPTVRIAAPDAAVWARKFADK